MAGQTPSRGNEYHKNRTIIGRVDSSAVRVVSKDSL
jgi:hypothetical protein